VQLIAWKDSSLSCVEWDVKPYSVTLTKVYCFCRHWNSSEWSQRCVLFAVCQCSDRHLCDASWRRLLGWFHWPYIRTTS